MTDTPYDKDPERYDDWFERHPRIFEAELHAITSTGGFSHPSLEVGVGPGRFAQRLGVTHGADLAHGMVHMARGRGIDAIVADALSLPWERETFQTVLFITSLCFVSEPREALKEARRVLTRGGTLIIAFVHKNSPMAKAYGDQKKPGGWYEGATFLTLSHISSIAESLGFAMVAQAQTLTEWSPDRVPLLHVEQHITDGGFAVVRFRLEE